MHHGILLSSANEHPHENLKINNQMVDTIYIYYYIYI
jgi:hypothetical protein